MARKKISIKQVSTASDSLILTNDITGKTTVIFY